MKKIYLHLFSGLLALLWVRSEAQTNIHVTQPLVLDILKGNYTPSTYYPTTWIDQHAAIASNLVSNLNTDSLYSYLEMLASFKNRNSGSDTLSDTIGIGAARNWAHSLFTDFSGLAENRLFPAFLEFDQDICGIGRHKNVIAVLPGVQNVDSGIIIIEAHMDSRCEGLCDSLCVAQGMEDNGSGCALVLELARVMSKFALKNTVVFMLTTAEEQGLLGANAMVEFCQQENIAIKCVLNNDVIGGIICGQTASPPGCTTPDLIDSLKVRIFSQGTWASYHKAFARFTKLEYLDEAMALEAIPMDIELMVPEDRTGRGGDHIPFHDNGYTAIRLTSAHEHGNADVDNPGYTDRQHSFRDVLGEDTNGDDILDSFFVDMNYLRRNTLINGVAASMAGIGPLMPTFTYTNDVNGICVTVSAPTNYQTYLCHVRHIDGDYDLDWLFYFSDSLSFTIPGVLQDSFYFVSMATVDSSGVESLLTKENRIKANGNGPLVISKEQSKIEGLMVFPNPTTGFFTVKFLCNGSSEVTLSLTDVMGREVYREVLRGEPGEQNFPIQPFLNSGLYFLRLSNETQILETKKLIVSNP